MKGCARGSVFSKLAFTSRRDICQPSNSVTIAQATTISNLLLKIIRSRSDPDRQSNDAGSRTTGILPRSVTWRVMGSCGAPVSRGDGPERLGFCPEGTGKGQPSSWRGGCAGQGRGLNLAPGPET